MSKAPDVAQWLRSLGLGRYEQAFRDADVDGEVLADLDESDLEKLGVSLGHRKKLLKAIAALAPEAEPGSAALAEGERRQVTVLFADLVDYTRLTRELGAEAMHGITDRFFGLADGVIERFGGTIDKHIGDCVMAVFGAPVAHGNDAERAVRAALAIRDAMPELSSALGCTLSTHIGIASGQVVASRGAGHKTYSITGDSVNLASRLTDQAEPGAILVSEPVRRLLADRLDHVEVEAFALKGLEAPVRAFRVVGLREPGAAERPFVGRQGELQQLESVLQACLGNGRGQAVHVRGEAGIGKTRLVEELQRHATAAGFACHKALVLDFGAGAGQDAIGALVRGLLGLAARDEAAACAALDAAERDGLVAAERRVFLNDLLDLPQPTALRALYDAMDHGVRSRGRQDALAELVERAGRQTARLLVVEDIHWSDGPTLGHLARLAQAAGAARAVLLMTSRLEGDPLDDVWRSSLAGSPLLTLDLGPLRDDEADVLARAYVDTNAELARRCIARAAGNPLFLDQLLRHAEESAEEGVPGSVQSLVQARLDHLSPADRQALQAASVLGQRFTANALGHLLGRPTYDCGDLVRHLLLRSLDDELLFGHALIRDGVYDSLLRSRRAALHLRAAEWFAAHDPALRAEHLDRAEDPGAPDAYLEAARGQIATYRYDVALSLAERGLAIARSAPQAFALSCLRGDILHDLGEMAAARDAYAGALAAAHDDAERCRAWLGLAAVKRVTDDLDGAFADLDRARAAAERHGLIEQLARIHFLRGNLYFPRGDIVGCLAEHETSLRLARKAESPELEAQALGGLGDAEYARGRMISSHRHLRRCVELAARDGFGRIEVANRSQSAHASLYFQPQQTVFDQALAAAEAAKRVGHHRAEINARLAGTFAASALGAWDCLEVQADATRAIVHRIGARRFLQGLLLHLGRAALAQGRRDEARALLEEALAISRETGVAFHGANILGAAAAALADPDERRRALAEGEQIIRQGCVAHNPLRFYPDAIEVALDLGEWHEAERYAAALEDFTQPEPLPWSEFFVARGRALAAFGRGQRDEDTKQELQRIEAEAHRLHYRTALPAIEQALAGL